ncbi:uracil-DNA glycosylase [Halobacillus fulvus]|nr:uracil-DNA glycosylase [Halobacillus fulvus]
MKIPESILQEAKKNIEPYDTEGFVLGDGNERANLMIVGEAPGENEVEKGEPFIGRAGKELDHQLETLGISREDIYITSVVRSRPWKRMKTKKGERLANRKPNQKEITAHAKLLDYQIETVDPDIIIALGGVAFERLTKRDDKMSDVVGEAIESPVYQYIDGEWKLSDKSYTIIPMYHPAAVFYNPKIRSDIEQSLQTLKRYLEQDE